MKKFVLVAGALAFAFANAASQRLVSLQVAETGALVAGVSKIGEMTGNPMIAAMIAPQIAQNPLAEFFGPARAGEAIGISVCGNSDTFKSLLENNAFPDGVYVAYPVKRTKAEFLAAHPGAAETNGVISVEGYAVVFSDDGRWAVATTDASRAAAGLSEIAVAKQPLNGDIVRIELSKEVVPQLIEMIGEDQVRTLVEGYENLKFALAIGEKSLEVKVAADAKKGSLLDKMGKISLAGDYFAFAMDDALIAQNEAQGGGSGNNAQVHVLIDLIRSLGIKTDFIAEDKKQPGVSRYTFDLKKAYAYFSSEDGKKACEKVDPMAFFEGLSQINTNIVISAASPAAAASFAIKGCKPKKSLARLFADMVPEAASKKPYAVSCGSFYAILRGIAAQLVPQLPADLRMQIEPVMMTLPAEEDCAIACYAYRDGSTHRVLARISAGELKGLSSVINSVAGFAMSCAMQGVDCDDEILEVEEDDED